MGTGHFSIRWLVCPETFNYWEPTHFLIYGTGLQTWEYRQTCLSSARMMLTSACALACSVRSPAYALRSYMYPLFHVAVARVAQLLLIEWLFGKVAIFYCIRFALAAATALCEVRFLRSVDQRFGCVCRRCVLLSRACMDSCRSQVSSLLFALFLLSTGMFHASVAMLPQTCTMCILLLAFANWMVRAHLPISLLIR